MRRISYAFLSVLFSLILAQENGKKTKDTKENNFPSSISKVEIDDDGNILVNSKYFLPLGLYDSGYNTYTWIKEENSRLKIKDKYNTFKDQLLDIKSKGFNAVLGAPSSCEGIDPNYNYVFSLEDFKVAEEVGLYVIPRVDINYARDSNILSQLKSQANLLFWNIHDEPELYPNGINEAKEIFKIVKSVDSRPIVVPMSDVKYYSEATDFMDINFPDTYFTLHESVGKTPDLSELLSGYKGAEPPYTSYSNVKDFIETTWIHMRKRKKTSVIPVINSNHIKGIFEPTPEQCYAMSFLALVYNAKGLMWFTFANVEPPEDNTNIPMPSGKPHWYILESPNNLWEAFPTLLSDVKKIEKFVYAKSYKGNVTNNQVKIHFKAKNVDGKLWILAVNVLSSTHDFVTFTVDKSITSIKEIISNTNVSFSSLQFSDSFKGYEVRAYEVNFGK